MKKTTLFILSVILLGFVACKSSQNSNDESSKLAGEINIDGSSTVYPITEAVAEEFRIQYPDVKISVGVSGTGGGFKKFTRGETQISDASRPIKQKEIDAANKSMIGYLELEVAYDGMAVVVNKENNWLESITIEELKKIWEPGAQNTIMKWNQIRAEWPNEEIHLYGPGTASGTYDYFTEAIVGESGASRGDYTASEDDNVLVQGIAGDKYALGFFGLAYYEENQDKLKLVSVDGGNGPVFPTFETVKNKEYVPLSRPLFIYVSKKYANTEVVNTFVKFYLENAATLSKEVGYISLPSEEYKAMLDKFNKFSSE